MDFLQITPLLQTFGLIGVCVFVFAESGLFFGFFLPGDSLLFTAGVFASAGYINVGLLFAGAFVCAVLGDSVGYFTGKKFGPKLFSRPDSFLLNKKNLDKTAVFYEKHGKKTIILARFVPVVRTFAPIMAGAGNMKYEHFLLYNVLGGFLWTGSMVLAGYFLGNSIENIDAYILPITGAIIIVSFVPIVIEIVRQKKW